MAQRRKQDEGELARRTRELLKASEQPYPDIFRATNIPENWLSRFAAGRVDDPSVNRVEALYRHLSGRQLEL